MVFVRLKNKETRKYLLNEFQDVKDKFVELIGVKYSGQDGMFGRYAAAFNYYTIVSHIVQVQDFQVLRDLALYVGDTAICNGIFVKDVGDQNAIHWGIKMNKLEMVQEMLNIEDVRNKCIDDKDELVEIVRKMIEYFDGKMVKYIVKRLQLTKPKINELIEYKYFDATFILTLL